jgi:hypothetical protein
MGILPQHGHGNAVIIPDSPAKSKQNLRFTCFAAFARAGKVKKAAQAPLFRPAPRSAYITTKN